MTLTKLHAKEVKATKACTGDMAGMKGHLPDVSSQVAERAVTYKAPGCT